MMTKTTSTTRAVLKKGIIIPLMTALVFSLCTKAVAQETIKKDRKNIYVSGEAFYQNTTFEIKDEKGKVIAKKKYSDLTEKQKKLAPPLVIHNYNDKPLSEKEIIEKIKKEEPKTFIIDEFNPKNIKTKKADPNAVYSISETTEGPNFPGGIDKFYKFVGTNYKAPSQPNLKGKVYITFIVEKDGSLSNIKSIKDIGFGTGEESIRVLKLCPKWIPGKIDGNPVRVLYSLPITIQS